jgi:hypothetical protein
MNTPPKPPPDKVSFRKVGGIWFLRIFRLRISFSISKK